MQRLNVLAVLLVAAQLGVQVHGSAESSTGPFSVRGRSLLQGVAILKGGDNGGGSKQSEVKGSTAVCLANPPAATAIDLLQGTGIAAGPGVSVTKFKADSDARKAGSGQLQGLVYTFTPKAGSGGKKFRLEFTVQGADGKKFKVKVSVTVDASCGASQAAPGIIANAGESLILKADDLLKKLGKKSTVTDAMLAIPTLGDTLVLKRTGKGKAKVKDIRYLCPPAAECSKGTSQQQIIFKVVSSGGLTSDISSNVTVDPTPAILVSYVEVSVNGLSNTGEQQLKDLGFEEVAKAKAPSASDGWVVTEPPSPPPTKNLSITLNGSTAAIRFHEHSYYVGALPVALGDVAANSPLLLAIGSNSTDDSGDDDSSGDDDTRRRLLKNGEDDGPDDNGDDSNDDSKGGDDSSGDDSPDDDSNDDSRNGTHNEAEIELENPPAITAMGLYVSLGCGQSGNITAEFLADTDEDFDGSDDDSMGGDDDGFEWDDHGIHGPGHDRRRSLLSRKLRTHTTAVTAAAPTARHLLKGGSRRWDDSSYSALVTVVQPPVSCPSSGGTLTATPQVGVWLSGSMSNASGYIRKVKVKARLAAGVSGPAKLYLGSVFLSRSPVPTTA